jgi:branched-subunit amino acid ABC-type transport system permease component
LLAARKEIGIASTEPEFTAEQIGWRFTVGTIVLVGAYIAWPMIPVVMATDLEPGLKAAISGVLGATPFLSKFVAAAIMGKPAYYFLKRTVYQRLRRRFAGTPAE